MIDVGDYVSYIKHVDGGFMKSAGYVSDICEHHACIDGKWHLYSPQDGMRLVAKQTALFEDAGEHPAGTWGTHWGSWSPDAPES